MSEDLDMDSCVTEGIVPYQTGLPRKRRIRLGLGLSGATIAVVALTATLGLSSAAQAGVQPSPSPNGVPSSCPGALPGTVVIKLTPPPRDVRLGVLESDNCIVAFDEQQDVLLSQSLTVDISTPGTYRTTKLKAATIGKGTRVRSHFLHADRLGAPTTDKVFDGTVVFDSAIVGVIVLAPSLNKSDRLGVSGTHYPAGVTQRGLEFNKTGTLDSVTWETKAPNTLTVHLAVANYLDQIRVITAVPPTPTPTPTPTPSPADLGTSQSVPPIVPVGDVFTFGITVHNYGPGVATQVQVTENVVGPLTIQSGSVVNGNCTVTTSTATCKLGTLGLDASATFEISARLDATGLISATASAAAASLDPDLANNSSSVSASTCNVAEMGLPTGGLSAWGHNSYGEVGDGTQTVRVTPVDVIGLGAGVSAVGGGYYHSLAVKPAGLGSVWAWGLNQSGQLGYPADTDAIPHPTPAEIPGLTQVLAVTGGSSFSVALRCDGTVWTFGLNSFNQLGHSSGGSTPQPVLLRQSGIPDAPLRGVRVIASGYLHTLALLGDGTVVAWGNNQYGQTSGNFTYAERVSGISAPLVSVAAAQGDSYALDNSGRIWSWGSNSYGQLGDVGRGSLDPTPRLVPGLPPIRNIAAGLYNGMALADDGGVWQWGCPPSTSSVSCTASPPAKVGGIPTMQTVAGGYISSGSLSPDRQLWTWGTSSGHADPQDTPAPVPGLGDVMATSGTPTVWLVLRTPSGSALAQTMTFAPLESSSISTPPLTLSATASSGLPVSYAIASTSAAICSVSGSVLTLLERGTCTVTASQVGNSIYLAATPVTQSLTATLGGFVQAVGTSLVLDGQPFRTFGAAIYETSNYGHTADPDQVFGWASAAHLNTLRLVDIFNQVTTDPGAPYAEADWQRIDALIARSRGAGMKVILDLSSYRNWLVNSSVISHGWVDNCMDNGDRTPVDYAALDPYTVAHRADWTTFMTWVANRVNKVTGVTYRNDSTILVVSIAGEPVGPGYGICGHAVSAQELTDFFAWSLGEWKSLDPHHLRSSGGLQGTYAGLDSNGNPIPSGQQVDGIAIFSLADNTLPSLHTYPPQATALPLADGQTPVLAPVAQSLAKPWFTEEFGFRQDDGDSFRASEFGFVYDEQTANGSAGSLFWNLGPEVGLGTFDVNPSTPQTWARVLAEAP